MIKSMFIFAAAVLQIVIGGAHLAGFISELDPNNLDGTMKVAVEAVADKPINLPLGTTRTLAELHSGYSVLFSVLLMTVGALNCVAAPSCSDRAGLHFGLVIVNLAGMLAVLWACYTYLLVFPGLIAAATAMIMFFSLFISSRGAPGASGLKN